MRIISKFILILLTVVSIVAASSCDNNKVYDTYYHTSINGWEKNDTLSFNIPKLKQDGMYSSILGLRTNRTYPFMGLTLIVEQTIYPERVIKTDTIDCNLTDQNGNTNGQGINYYQYEFHVSDMNLKAGDSIHVCVRHDMKREILPGISDVGIKLSMAH